MSSYRICFSFVLSEREFNQSVRIPYTWLMDSDPYSSSPITMIPHGYAPWKTPTLWMFCLLSLLFRVLQLWRVDSMFSPLSSKSLKNRHSPTRLLAHLPKTICESQYLRLIYYVLSLDSEGHFPILQDSSRNNF